MSSKDQKSLKLSASNQAHVVDARLTVGAGIAIVEIDEPRVRRTRDIRRTRPEVRRSRVGKIGRIDAGIRYTGMNQSEEFALRRHAPVGVGAERGGVDRREERLGVAQVAG